MKTNPVAPECLQNPKPRRPRATPRSAWFVSDWLEVVLFHLYLLVAVLQPSAPFELDCRDGQAYVSLVSFEMRGIQPAGPYPDSQFLPARTGGGVVGIHNTVRCSGLAWSA